MSGIIKQYRVNNTNRSIDWFLDRDHEPVFDMDHPYQRGVVWGVKRKRNLIKSILMGVPIPAIVVNDRFAAGFQHPGYGQERNWMYAIVDGKQRVSTIQQFVAGRFAVPYGWFRDDEVSAVPGAALRFGDLTLPEQRGFRNTAIPVVEGRFNTLAQERELFDLINFGGLTQGDVDEDLD